MCTEIPFQSVHREFFCGLKNSFTKLPSELYLHLLAPSPEMLLQGDGRRQLTHGLHPSADEEASNETLDHDGLRLHLQEPPGAE
jgi:uncharacterized protein YcgL (UPF0745 family)